MVVNYLSNLVNSSLQNTLLAWQARNERLEPWAAVRELFDIQCDTGRNEKLTMIQICTRLKRQDILAALLSPLDADKKFNCITTDSHIARRWIPINWVALEGHIALLDFFFKQLSDSDQQKLLKSESLWISAFQQPSACALLLTKFNSEAAKRERFLENDYRGLLYFAVCLANRETMADILAIFTPEEQLTAIRWNEDNNANYHHYLVRQAAKNRDLGTFRHLLSLLPPAEQLQAIQATGEHEGRYAVLYLTVAHCRLAQLAHCLKTWHDAKEIDDAISAAGIAERDTHDNYAIIHFAARSNLFDALQCLLDFASPETRRRAIRSANKQVTYATIAHACLVNNPHMVDYCLAQLTPPERITVLSKHVERLASIFLRWQGGVNATEDRLDITHWLITKLQYLPPKQLHLTAMPQIAESLRRLNLDDASAFMTLLRHYRLPACILASIATYHSPLTQRAFTVKRITTIISDHQSANPLHCEQLAMALLPFSRQTALWETRHRGPSEQQRFDRAWGLIRQPIIRHSLTAAGGFAAFSFFNTPLSAEHVQASLNDTDQGGIAGGGRKFT